MKQSIEKIDPNFAVVEAGNDTAWYDIRPLGVEGRGWDAVASYYDRLPAKAETIVPKSVWGLSHHSAGMAARFVTDSTSIAFRWKLRFESLAMAHMPATGVSGLDLYVQDKDGWKWATAGRPEKFPVTTSKPLDEMAPGIRTFMLFLPLYNGVESVEVGIDPGAFMGKAAPRKDTRPLCFYGTSIVQGGCASRPGMAYPALIARWLDRPHVNLGFSGNGKMEKELAELLGEIDACAYVLDAVPNMGAALVRANMELFLRILRSKRPSVPIVMVENITYSNASIRPVVKTKTDEANRANRDIYERLIAGGATHLYYVESGGLLGSDGEGTVDGAHPTDLGFLRMAEAIAPTVKKALE